MYYDPYELLGVERGASQEMIKRAYYKKARECHPDLHPDDPEATEKMQRINEAYDMLCSSGGVRARHAGQSARGAQRAQWQYYYHGTDAQKAWQSWEDIWRQAAASYDPKDPWGRASRPAEAPKPQPESRRAASSQCFGQLLRFWSGLWRVLTLLISGMFSFFTC